MLLRMECVCRECEKVECHLTVLIVAEEGKEYRPPNRCIAQDRRVSWHVERVEVMGESHGE